jgi:hypothetical protein
MQEHWFMPTKVHGVVSGLEWDDKLPETPQEAAWFNSLPSSDSALYRTTRHKALSQKNIGITFAETLSRIRSVATTGEALGSNDWATMASAFHVYGINVMNESFL